MQVNSVEMLCTRCGRKFEHALGIPGWLECVVCGCDVLIPAEPLTLCHMETMEELAKVPAGSPFQAYALKVPKTLVLRRKEVPRHRETPKPVVVEEISEPKMETEGQGSESVETPKIEESGRRRGRRRA